MGINQREIQIMINAVGFGPLVTDGVFGAKTIDAIKRFQRSAGLMADGIAGPKTVAALSSRAPSPPVATDVPPSPVATGDFPMSLSARGMAMLGTSEGIRTKAYYDTKHIVTIGIGATWGSDTFQDWWNKNKPGQTFSISSTLTRAEIDEVTALMITEEYGKAVNAALGRAIPQHQFDAAVHAIYNMGPAAVKWRWFLALKAGDVKESANLLRTGYNKPPELKGRRQKEGDLMEFGKYH